MMLGSGSSNQHIIDELDRAMVNLTATQDRSVGSGKQFRVRSLVRAMVLLAQCDHPLQNAERVDEWYDALKRDSEENDTVLGMSDKTVAKIKEIVIQGELLRNVVFEQDLGIKVRRELQTVHGIGEATAHKLYITGVRSVQDLVDALAAEAAGESSPVIDFLANQGAVRVGLRHYDDLQQRMPRVEAAGIRDEVIKAASTVLGKNFVEAMAAGSFRRRKLTNGDVDVLIKIRHAAKKEEMTEMMRMVVQPLHDNGFIIDELTDHDRVTRDGNHTTSMWMGVVKLPGHDTSRRLDIKMYLPEAFAFAMLYFTGDAEFNRGMRNMAHKFNPPMSLSDHGLYPVDKAKIQGGKEIGTSLVCHTEEEIFERLGLVYKAPHERLGVPSIVPLLPGCGAGFKWLDWPKNQDYSDGFFDESYLLQHRSVEASLEGA